MRAAGMQLMRIDPKVQSLPGAAAFAPGLAEPRRPF
jgi:hypothetical protein